MAKEQEIEGEASQAQQQGDYVEPSPASLFDPQELGQWSFYRAVIAEFIATLLFLYVTIAWCFGGMIFILVCCTAGISGGHINPAVAFGLFLARKVSLVRAIAYIVAQCMVAICGVGIVKGKMKDNYNAQGGGANVVAATYSKGTALGAEIIGTFVVLYAVFSATDPKRKACDSHVPVSIDSIIRFNCQIIKCFFAIMCTFWPFTRNVHVLASLRIGFALLMVHLATIPIIGTGINPARSFGAAVIYNKDKAWDDQRIFWVWPFVGALAAAIYYEHILRATAIKALGSFTTNPIN